MTDVRTAAPSTTEPTAAPRRDFVSPAFHELVQQATPATLEVLFKSPGRHRLLAGKSARLLKAGDRIALCDLGTIPDEGGARVTGVATITDCFTSAAGHTYAHTERHGLFVTPGSRLVVFERAALPTGTTTPSDSPDPKEH